MATNTLPSLSKVHVSFVNGPMGNKPSVMMPGIGPVAAGHLRDNGFSSAYMVYGQFLVMGQDQKKFTAWLQGEAHCNKLHASNCYQGLHDYTAEHL